MDQSVPIRTRLAGTSLALAGACLAVAPFLAGAGHESAAGQADGVATGAVGSVAKAFVLQAAALLVIPGLAALVGRTRGRGSLAVTSGAVVLGAGLFGFYGFVLTAALEDAAAGDGRLDPAIADAIGRMEGSAVGVAMFVLALLLAHLLGVPWLSWALVRARQVPWWVASTATVGTACAFFGSGTALEAPGWVLVGLTLVLVGSTLWRVPASSTGRAAGRDATSSWRRAPAA
jgi:hypothetical protein